MLSTRSVMVFAMLVSAAAFSTDTIKSAPTNTTPVTGKVDTNSPGTKVASATKMSRAAAKSECLKGDAKLTGKDLRRCIHQKRGL